MGLGLSRLGETLGLEGEYMVNNRTEVEGIMGNYDRKHRDIGVEPKGVGASLRDLGDKETEKFKTRVTWAVTRDEMFLAGKGLKFNSCGLSFCVSGTDSSDVLSSVPSAELTTVSGIVPLDFPSPAQVLRERSRSLFPRLFLYLGMEHLLVRLKIERDRFYVHPRFPAKMSQQLC
ncbi:hypothetical protein HAX54_005464 [Datura stramonium]|uniref:Uncharacterized protein n=1 Tax=Datura stramonium TaxID=4076 RepID=A0ABS8TAE9_DATST|nr:hypothetical protein [Datura stramonium]